MSRSSPSRCWQGRRESGTSLGYLPRRRLDSQGSAPECAGKAHSAREPLLWGAQLDLLGAGHRHKRRPRHPKRVLGRSAVRSRVTVDPSLPPQPAEPEPVARRLGRRARQRPLLLLLVAVVAIIAVYVVPTPWALHIGGRFTPLETWDGYGQVRGSNGGRYVLFAHLRGGILGGGANAGCGFFGCDTLHGDAKLCTLSGKTFSFGLSGDVHSWWSTDGARTSINLSGRPLPAGWVVAFRGRWKGPALPLENPDNSFTEVLTRAGAIRHTTSTADAGTAFVTLQSGSLAAFDQECRALAASAH